MLALSGGDAIIKLTNASFSLWQMYVLRSLIATPIIIIVIKLRSPTIPLTPRSIHWTLLRSLLLASMWIAYYTALPKIPLSIAAAAYYTAPLFIVLLAPLMTTEKISSAAWLSIALGLVGMLLILRPETDTFNRYALLPIAAAVLYAIAMLLTRTKCVDENPLVLALALNVTFIMIGAGVSAYLSIMQPTPTVVAINPLLLGNWMPIDLSAGLALFGLAFAIVVGSISAAIAYQNGPPTLVASFDYAYLAFSIMWGLLLFAELPDLVSTVGIALIALAGLLALKTHHQ